MVPQKKIIKNSPKVKILYILNSQKNQNVKIFTKSENRNSCIKTQLSILVPI